MISCSVELSINRPVQTLGCFIFCSLPAFVHIYVIMVCTHLKLFTLNFHTINVIALQISFDLRYFKLSVHRFKVQVRNPSISRQHSTTEPLRSH